MLTQSEILKLIRENYKFLSSEYGVTKIGLFGSFAKNKIKDGSDVDILIELQKPIGFKFLKLVEYLENLLGTRVDVITKDGLENIRIKSVADDIRRNMLYV